MNISCKFQSENQKQKAMQKKSNNNELKKTDIENMYGLF